MDARPPGAASVAKLSSRARPIPRIPGITIERIAIAIAVIAARRLSTLVPGRKIAVRAASSIIDAPRIDWVGDGDLSIRRRGVKQGRRRGGCKNEKKGAHDVTPI
jgi:hypothetical protein